MKVLSPAKISREEMLQCTAFSLIKELERLMILPNILHQSINVLYCVNNLKLFHVILCVDSTEESGIPPSLVQQILHLDAVLNVLDNTYMYCYGCNDGLCPGIMSRHGFLLSMVSLFILTDIFGHSRSNQLAFLIWYTNEMFQCQCTKTLTNKNSIVYSHILPQRLSSKIILIGGSLNMTMLMLCCSPFMKTIAGWRCLILILPSPFHLYGMISFLLKETIEFHSGKYKINIIPKSDCIVIGDLIALKR